MKERKLQPISLIKRDAKVLNKILINWIYKHVKKITHSDQCVFISEMQAWLNVCEPVAVMQHLSNLVTEITELCQQIHPRPLKKSAPLQRKIPVETRSERNTPQHNKGCKWKTYNQHYNKCVRPETCSLRAQIISQRHSNKNITALAQH